MSRLNSYGRGTQVPRPHLLASRGKGSRWLMLLGLLVSLLARAQGNAPKGRSDTPQGKKLPTGVILVKGAWSSASDVVTPVPEDGRLANHVYTNPYFGLTYPVSADWTERYSGPPPSDSGYYVLAQIRPADTFQGTSRGTILISAQDLFFTLAPTRNVLELIDHTAENLPPEYKVEKPPTEVQVSGRSFIRFDYTSPAAELHWRVLATEIRCHVVEFVFTSRDAAFAEGLIEEMNHMTLPLAVGLTSGTGGGEAPVCLRDYASDENVLERVDPVFTERALNPIPVRIVIDKEGKVKQIHFLSAFPDQAKAITDALSKWRVRPYREDGHPREVETGLVFGRVPPRTPLPSHPANLW